MSIIQPKLTDPSAVEDEVTERKLLNSPFILEKKIKGHSDIVYECTKITFPDGQDRIITCSMDKTIRIFNLEEEKCEKIIKHTNAIYSVHFYEEEGVLMTTDGRGELGIWKLFPKIKITKKIKVSRPGSGLWRITQISSNEFLCCVASGVLLGFLYKISFNENSNNWISEEIEYPTYQNNETREGLRCITQLICQKNIILFAGGNLSSKGGEDFTIKSIDLNNNNNKFRRFPKKHSNTVSCLTSFVNTKRNEEIILSGSFDGKIIFWSLEGEYLKEIKLNVPLHCFLNDFSRNSIFFAGGKSNVFLGTLSLKTEVFEKCVKKNHKDTIFSLKWLREEYKNTLISCSGDKSFNIYEIEEIISRKMEDIEKTFGCLMELSDCSIRFKNKKIKFWYVFIDEINLDEFKHFETTINEKTLFSIIMGKSKIEIPLGHLPDYYFFFKILNLNHCIATINQKTDKITDFEDIYFLFKDFCLKYENEIIQSWFTTKKQKLEDFQPSTFKTSFALSLFNKMRKTLNDEIGLLMFEKDIFFSQISYQIKKYKSVDVIEPIKHKDFEGVNNKEELNSDYYLEKLYENRTSQFNLTLLTTDNKELKSHKEILILRFDFFFRLFNFGGLEVTEYKETGKITLVDLMSSDVVEVLLKYAYLGELELKNEGIRTLETIIKILIFCDQFNEQKLMKEVSQVFRKFIGELESLSIQEDEESVNKKKEEILDILSDLSSYLGGNDKVLGILRPRLVDFGFGFIDCLNGFLNQSSKMRDIELLLEESEKEKFKLKNEKEESEKRLQERILELEKMVGEIKDEDDEGVGEGRVREREEDDEEDEEIKKEQPKRKKRKINRK